MRYGDWNKRNRELYEQCHYNPYLEIKERLMKKKKLDTALEELMETYKEHINYAYQTGYEDGKYGVKREELILEPVENTKESE